MSAEGGRLPDTGSGSATLVAGAAAVLLALGAATLWYSRRRGGARTR
ncbi:LPXTG cell wall anchor domain-containing protein [Desertihabitans brevis]|uniref:LPXTG cell wall anchor domain-containing protein n=1 Tax=Desertihabitans brevis TaxID=2268447 RepID=A0A367YYR1_9ACTN|nr:LPXTG cell wall anchor domain-containing protein [Desertihabitans brevis]